MFLPVEEEHDQTEAKQWIDKKVNKQGKANFWRRTAFTERSEKESLLKDIQEILWRIFRRYCEGKGNGEETESEGKKEKEKKRKVKAEGRRKKNTMQINNEGNIDGLINSTGPIELLMIDSKWELRRIEFLKSKKKLMHRTQKKNLNSRINLNIMRYIYMSCIS